MKKEYLAAFSIFIIITSLVVFSQRVDNNSITIKLDVLSIEPKNYTIGSDIELVLIDYDGKEHNINCECKQKLGVGETQIIVVENFTQDYFKIILTLEGSWNKTVVNLNVNGTDKDIESFNITAKNRPFVYELPYNVTGMPYFRI